FVKFVLYYIDFFLYFRDVLHTLIICAVQKDLHTHFPFLHLPDRKGSITQFYELFDR
ncbi:MAG: hypothetical protein K0S44_2052, partial [Bacteroidetes bacterium]|nr:hypothetical protein [Bacteroidota bacterium]